jgi:ABC-type multidrug transport system ATPase subunit
MGLETLYDVLTSVEKIGYITDLKWKKNFLIMTLFYLYIALEIEKLVLVPDSKTKILDNISLNIDQGEIIYIDGANGSGKTTLIRILSGPVQPTEQFL